MAKRKARDPEDGKNGDSMQDLAARLAQHGAVCCDSICARQHAPLADRLLNPPWPCPAFTVSAATGEAFMQMFDEPDQPAPRAPKRAKAEQPVLKSPPYQQNVSFIQIAKIHTE